MPSPIENKDELLGFMASMPEENYCIHCAMFAHAFDGKMYAVIKSQHIDIETDEPVLCFMNEKTKMDFFGRWDSEFVFHCYGLVIETKKGEWKIIED